MPKFALFCGARTGSSAFYELFKDMGFSIRFEPFRPIKWNVYYDVHEQLAKFYKRHDAIKHLYEHIAPSQNELLIDWLIKKKIRIVFLRRKQAVFHALSKALAFQTGFWSLNFTSVENFLLYKMTELQPISVDELKGFIQQVMLSEALYLPMLQDGNLFQVDYEEVFNRGFEETYAKIAQILEFLEIPLEADTEFIVNEHFCAQNKQNNFEVYRRIPNWEEIKQEFEIEELKDEQPPGI